jgi:hypothetical protein
MSTNFQRYFKQYGIHRQLTATGTPQQNGIAERKIRHLLETTRSLLFSAKLPTYLWEEAARIANYLSNRVPIRALHRVTPFEVYTGQRPNLSHLQVFGSAAFLHIQDKKELDPKSHQLVFVGCDLQTKGYRCLDYHRKRIIISRDVFFNEEHLGIPSMKDPPATSDDILKAFFDQNSIHNSSLSSPNLSPDPFFQSTNSLATLANPYPVNPELFFPFSPELDSSSDLDPHSVVEQPSLAPRRSSQFRHQNFHLEHYILSIFVDDFDMCLPEVAPPLPGDNLTFQQALGHEGWREAIQEEMNSIHKNHTWDLVPLPPGKRASTSKWVYKTKPGLVDSNTRLKARLVARGFEQKYGVDFEETFAPVVKWSTIRASTARVAQLQHKIHHLDVKTAFFYGHITDEFYMVQPLGFTILGKEHLVCRVNRALYGLRQSPRMWYEKIDTYLRTLGLTRSTSDYNMYYLGHSSNRIVLVLYVDDLFILGGDETKIQWLKTQLHTQFDMTNLGSSVSILVSNFKD